MKNLVDLVLLNRKEGYLETDFNWKWISELVSKAILLNNFRKLIRDYPAIKHTN
jgi:hypothetical protein